VVGTGDAGVRAASGSVTDAVGAVLGAGSDTASAGGPDKSCVAGTLCSTAAISPAMLADETEVLWMTSPSSPGLNTRIEIAMLQPEQVARSGTAVEPDPQSQIQFHVH
jgi:hypothetical protein